MILTGCERSVGEFTQKGSLYDEALSYWDSDEPKALSILEKDVRNAVLQGDHEEAAKAHHLEYYIYERLGDGENKFKSLIKAQYHAELAGNHELLANIYNNIAYFYYSKGLWDKCILYGRMALARVDDKEGLLFSRIAFNLGGALSKADHWEESNEVLMLIQTESATRHIHQLEWLALNYYHQNEFDQAIEHAETCLGLIGDPSNPIAHRILNTLGLIHKAKKNYDIATRYFQSALQLEPDYYYGIANLAFTLEKTDKIDEAIQHYETLRKWDLANETNISVLTEIHKALNRLQALYHKKGNQAQAEAVRDESNDLLEKRMLTEAAQKELEAIYALDQLKESALNNLLEEREYQASMNRNMAILFAGLLSIVLISFFAWAMYFHRRRLESQRNEVMASANDLVNFITVHTSRIDS